MQRALLNVKSDFSLLWGTRSPADVVRKAAALGYDAVGLADRDGLYGLPEFLAEAKRRHIRAIIGAEVTDPATRQSALLYPMTQTGYANLCRVLTERHVPQASSLQGRGQDACGTSRSSALKGPKRIARGEAPGCEYPRVHEALKGRNSRSFAPSGLDVDSGACYRGFHPRLLSYAPSGQNACSTLLKRVRQDACGTSAAGFSLERALCRYGEGLAIVTDSLRVMKCLAGHGQLYVRMGHSLKRPPPEVSHLPRAIVPPAIFFDQDDYELHRLLRAIDLKGRLSSIRPEQLADEAATFQPWDKIASRFSALPEAIEGTERLLDALRFDGDFSEILFPEFDCPEGMSVIDLLRCKTYEGARKRYGLTSEGARNARARIPCARTPSRTDGRGNPFPRGSQDGNPAEYECEIGISHQRAARRQRIGISHQPAARRQRAGASPSPSLPTAVVDRIEQELDLIEQKGFASYFLVVDEIVRRSPRICGRGSAAASIVSYALGITNVDPIRHHLMFERFLNPGRKDPPDIDVDFAWDERDEVLEWVLDRYGTDRAAMVANHNRFRPRMALRETARVFGIPEREISTVTHRLPWCWQTDEAGDLDEIVRGAPRMAGVDLDPPWPEIIALAGRLIGKPRGLSVHCGGIVLTPGAIWRRSPIQPSAKGVNVIHWDKDGAEDMGLVKIDLLGNRSLAVIRDAIGNLRAEGIAFDETRWDPINDPKTQTMLASGRTMGVFYVESPAMRQLQLKTGRGDFDHLVINTSIIRPAANAYTTEYVKRVHGVPYEPIHPLLADILAETYGIMVYQEDVSRVAMAMAGFSCEDADRLRKIMSKKDRELELAHFYRQFVEGARAKGVSDDVIDEVFRMILAFSGYSFCKPHSASYTMVSYQSAYLKAHHPAAFMAAVMANHGGFYSTQAYVSEARRLGLEVLGPDINLSERKFVSHQGRIVTGLAEIKGLSISAQDRILEERERNGPFTGLGDFLSRTDVGYADAKRLILCGAFDRAEPSKNRPTLLWALKIRSGTACPARGGPAGRTLFAADAKTDLVPTPDLKPYTRVKTLELEYELLNFLAGAHPLEVFGPRDRRPDWTRADCLSDHIGKTVGILSWPISAKTITTAAGQDMQFVSFEDETDIYEAVLFPRQYRRYANLLFCDFPVIVTGKVDEDFGAISVIVNHIARA